MSYNKTMKVLQTLINFSKKIIKLSQLKIFRIIFFLGVLSFTFILRAHSYERVPTMGHLEEQMFAWAGIHLIERGVPVAWTSLDFPERATVYRGRVTYQGGKPDAYVRLVQPWLEHPPVFSLIVGGAAHYFGANRDQIIPTAYIRMPMVIMAAFTTIMVFLIARMVSGYWTGILAMLLYGTIPIMVLGSRMAVPENFIALLYSVVVYLLLRFQQKQKFIYLAFIPILAGLAGLSKATGFFMILLAVYVAIASRWYKGAIYLALAIIPFVAAFFAYGLSFDQEIFWKINAIQSGRPVGFASLGSILTTPAYDIYQLLDSWFVFSLLAAVFFIFAPHALPEPLAKLKRFILLSFVFAIAVVMVSGGETDVLPWYRFPAFPILAVIAAWGVEMIIKRADFFSTFLAAGLLLGNRHLLANDFRPDTYPMKYRLIFSGLMAPSLLQTLMDEKWLKKISQVVIVGIIVIGIYFNSKYIYNVFQLNCENKDCVFGPTIPLSTINFPIIWRVFELGDSYYH
jgi:hypothetical protein